MVKNRILEIKKALDEELYNCALALTLTLPDICGKYEFPDDTSTRNRYIRWFNAFAKQRFTCDAIVIPGNQTQEYVRISAEECYALRCSFLHSGNYELEKTELKNVHLHVHLRNGSNYNHMVRDDVHSDWDLYDICNNICEAVADYCDTHPDIDHLTDEIRIDRW